MAKNYTEGKNKIFVHNAAALTEQEKAEIKLIIELTGKKVDFSKPEKEKNKDTGCKKVEIIYYLETVAPDKVKEFTDICEDKNYMAALRWFKVWYKGEKKADYDGEAATLIKNDGKKAEARIKELTEIEEEKRKKKAEEKKKKNKK